MKTWILSYTIAYFVELSLSGSWSNPSGDWLSVEKYWNKTRTKTLNILLLFVYPAFITILIDIMQKHSRTYSVLITCLAVNVLVFTFLAPFSHIHDSHDGVADAKDIHVHIAHEHESDSPPDESGQRVDDDHSLELSQGILHTSYIPVHSQSFFSKNHSKHLSCQLFSDTSSSYPIESAPGILYSERGSPQQNFDSLILPHFFTDLSPPLG